MPQVADIYQGQFSLEPDNDYHNLRAELSRSLKWNGQLSLAAAWGTMRQDDPLLPPVTCTGTGGIFISPSADYTFNCADWNTSAALSQRTANARIDTGLLDAKITLHPSPKLGWHAGLRWLTEGEQGEPPKIKGATLLIAKADGSLWLAENEFPAYPLLDKYTAVGAGAMAAMNGGANAGDAVKAAVRLDAYTSDPIQILKIEPVPKRRRVK